MVALPPTVVPGTPVTGTWGNQVIAALAEHDTLITNAGFIGEMKIWPGDTAPVNHLFCRGQSLDRTTYAALFGVIGIKFGSVDGTHFNLPNMQGMVPVGLNTGTAVGMVGGQFTGAVGDATGTVTAVLPSHDHGGGVHTHPISMTSAFPDRDHSHYVSANTSDVSAYHTHTLPELGIFYRYEPTVPEFTMMISVNPADLGMPTNRPGGWGVNTSADGSHYHNVSAYTGGQSTGHTHGITGTTNGAGFGRTDATGSSGTNQNIQPSMTVNYIIKAT